MGAPVFFYDFSSPYAYLAASRVDEVLPVQPAWQPVAFGVIVQRLGKVPWSFADDRRADFSEIERRAAHRGLPPVRYPDGWPTETYSLAPLRAAMLATESGVLRELSHELFRIAFAEGRNLADVDTVLDAAERVGMVRDEVRTGIQDQAVKDQLRSVTGAALTRGVTGVPTVAFEHRLFWGDDRLEDAAAALGHGG